MSRACLKAARTFPLLGLLTPGNRRLRTTKIGEAEMKPFKQIDNETALLKSVIDDLRIAEGAGDIENQESLHSELYPFAYLSDYPSIRKAASRVINREMSDMASFRGFLRLIAELEESGGGELAQMLSDFAEFGRNTTTHPSIRALVAGALVTRRNAA
jgi:hypothetical protein